MQTDDLFPIQSSHFSASPFPHFSTGKVLDPMLAQALLNWLIESKKWKLTRTDFYTQYEFSLLDHILPAPLDLLTSGIFIAAMKQFFQEHFKLSSLELAGITAHRLTEGHKVGVHNDFIGKEETHRLVIQLNENWQEDNGGFLMLFNSRNPKDVHSVIRPIHNTGLGFEISEKSYHAVSTVYGFERYTLVYTFNAGN